MRDLDTATTRGQASSDVLSSAASSTLPSACLTGSGAKLPAALKADCSQCAGLCCVAPAFYAVQGFGFDKPAHTPCRHLTRADRCAIHAELGSRGFPGCAAFDCYGAGQRVTQQLFPRTSWRASDEVAERIFAAYACVLALHQLMALLVLAEGMALPPALASRMRLQRARLDELCQSEQCLPGHCDIARLERETMSLLREAYPLERPVETPPPSAS